MEVCSLLKCKNNSWENFQESEHLLCCGWHISSVSVGYSKAFVPGSTDLREVSQLLPWEDVSTSVEQEVVDVARVINKSVLSQCKVKTLEMWSVPHNVLPSFQSCFCWQTRTTIPTIYTFDEMLMHTVISFHLHYR